MRRNWLQRDSKWQRKGGKKRKLRPNKQANTTTKRIVNEPTEPPTSHPPPPKPQKRLHRDRKWCQPRWGTIMQQTQGRRTKLWMWNNHRDKQEWWFVWERLLYVDGAFIRVPLLFSCCCFSFLFHSTFICSLDALVLRHHLPPLSVPCNAADGLCERCGRSQRISIYLTQTRPSSFPHSLMQHMQESLDPHHRLFTKIYCGCLADRAPRLSPGAPVLSSLLQASVCNKPTFAFPLDCVFLFPLVEKNCQHSSTPDLLPSSSSEWWRRSLISPGQLMT